MSKYPDVQMQKCPVRGIVFYADGLGERAFKTADQAQQAHEEWQRRKELTAHELALSCPNRVVCSKDGISIYTNDECVNSIPCRDKRHVRQVIGTLSEWSTHTFVWV